MKIIVILLLAIVAQSKLVYLTDMLDMELAIRSAISMTGRIQKLFMDVSQVLEWGSNIYLARIWEEIMSIRMDSLMEHLFPVK